MRRGNQKRLNNSRLLPSALVPLLLRSLLQDESLLVSRRPVSRFLLSSSYRRGTLVSSLLALDLASILLSHTCSSSSSILHNDGSSTKRGDHSASNLSAF